jgi:hypothetical protein
MGFSVGVISENVILSGESVSRSEADSQSKDLYNLKTPQTLQGIFSPFSGRMLYRTLKIPAG